MSNNEKFLDDEERDLEKAIEKLDLAQLETPSKQALEELKAAARKHRAKDKI